MKMPFVGHRTQRFDGTQLNTERLHDSAVRGTRLAVRVFEDLDGEWLVPAVGRVSGLENENLRWRVLAARAVSVLWLTARPDPDGASSLRSPP